MGIPGLLISGGIRKGRTERGISPARGWLAGISAAAGAVMISALLAGCGSAAVTGSLMPGASGRTPTSLNASERGTPVTQGIASTGTPAPGEAGGAGATARPGKNKPGKVKAASTSTACPTQGDGGDPVPAPCARLAPPPSPGVGISGPVTPTPTPSSGTPANPTPVSPTPSSATSFTGATG
jgi:hypothetical protein